MPDTPQIDPSARQIINANLGVSNTIDIEVFNHDILQTLKRCKDVLAAHCGPLSGYAMLSNTYNPDKQFEPNIFTRDGITILGALEFLAPLDNIVKDILVYVGQRVDSIAKDGTTTSMLLFAHMLSYLIKHKTEALKENLSIYQLKSQLKSFFEDIKELARPYIFTVDDLLGTDTGEDRKMEIAGKIAFMQAMSSSGGDYELATAMREIFRRSPSITWDFISYRSTQKEHPKAFRVEVDDFDTRIRCIGATDDVFNAYLGTEYEESDVNVLVFADGLLSNAAKTTLVYEFIAHYEEPEPLLLIATHFDAHLINYINERNKTRDKKIVAFQFAPEQRLSGQPYPWELMILSAKAGVKPYSDNTVSPSEPCSMDYTFKVSKAHWHDGYLDLYELELLKDKDKTEVLHPFYLHPEQATPYYTEVLSTVERMLKQYREGHKKEGSMFQIFLDMYNRLATIKRPFLRIGGQTHELLANQAVVQDVQGAIMSSLNNGFFISGVLGLYAAVSHYDSREASSFIQVLHSALLSALQAVILVTFCNRYEGMGIGLDESQSQIRETIMYSHILEDPFQYCNVLGFLKQESNEITHSIKDFLDKLDDPDADQSYLLSCYPILHPVAITTELFKRAEELLLRFLLSNEIVVFGGMALDEKTQKSLGEKK